MNKMSLHFTFIKNIYQNHAIIIFGSFIFPSLFMDSSFTQVFKGIFVVILSDLFFVKKGGHTRFTALIWKIK